MLSSWTKVEQSFRLGPPVDGRKTMFAAVDNLCSPRQRLQGERTRCALARVSHDVSKSNLYGQYLVQALTNKDRIRNVLAADTV